MWSTVDPLCEMKPWQSPYMYCSGNPVNRTDPTGMLDWHPDEERPGDWIADAGDNVQTLSDRIGMSIEDAIKAFSHQKNWDRGKGNENGIANVEGHTLHTSESNWVTENFGDFSKLDDRGYGPLNEDDLRLPDYYTLNVSATLPNSVTKDWVGWNGTATIDRHLQIYLSPLGASFGKSIFSPSFSFTANWMLQSKTPTAAQTYNFLSGHGASVAGGYWFGLNLGISPANKDTKTSFGFGLVSPQIGVSYNYTPDSLLGIPLILNKQ